MLRRLDELVVPGLPLLVGMSRKSMLGMLTGRDADDRVSAGVAAHVLAVLRGARIVRARWQRADQAKLAAVVEGQCFSVDDAGDSARAAGLQGAGRWFRRCLRR